MPALDSHDPASDYRTHPGRLGFGMNAHHPRQRIAIGDADGIVSLRECGQNQIHRIRRAAQKREAAGDPQLDELRTGVADEFLVGKSGQRSAIRGERLIGHQAKNPCRYQSGGPPRPSPIRPLR